jgi:xanthine dehydrogenase large subunit
MPGTGDPKEMSATLIGGVHQRLAHESAHKHVSGRAVYIDDIPEPSGIQHVHIELSTHPHARIVKLDLAQVEAADGVTAVLTADDISGINDFGYMDALDDRVLAGDLVEYAGQAIFAVVGHSIEQARRAAKAAIVEYDVLEPVLTVDEAMKRNQLLAECPVLARGDAGAALERATHRLQGRHESGGQEHFYLEGHISMALPKEDGDVHLLSSTQDPTAVQHIVAKILGRPANSVTVEVRRMGGAFGGKETQATQFAAIAALAACKTGASAKCRLDRDDDMIITGKRHECLTEFDVGFDGKGRIEGLDLNLYMRCGNSFDQSMPVIVRAVYHIDNCYFLENIKVAAYPCKTNTVSAIAFRGFGTPQAYVHMEHIIDQIAFHLGMDPLDVRKVNMYGTSRRNTTPFGQVVKHNILPKLLKEIEASSDYAARRTEIRKFNETSRFLKRGIALVPIKYGVGFGLNFLNQAGALIHIYQDGSVHLNHGGTEMGQGLFVKIAQVVAEEFQIDVEHIKVSSTATDKVPNTIATAASSGTDFNGMAAQAAARKLRRRLTKFASDHFKVGHDQIAFLPNRVRIGNQEMPFPQLVELAFLNRVALSATGHYKVPANNYDASNFTGNPHRYYVFGASVAEVIVDTLTGENRTTRVDILHDVGRSINPSIDLGQLEGGFIQGMGWLTTEELYWDPGGILRTHAPSTYKIPACSDRPSDFRMNLVEWSENKSDSVFRSKAIGEPPLCLAVSVLCALRDAVASLGDYTCCPDLDAPATPERIFFACDNVRRKAESASRGLTAASD